MIETMPRDSWQPVWKRAALWLAFLAPFFYLSYGFANHLAAQRSDVGSIVFDWEHAIPFVPWTIFPYWSINLFYGLSLFVCRSREALDVHGRRLLTAQLIAVSCFLLFPLGFSFVRPDAHGAAGVMFAALSSFDKPFNQAPSLHIALLVILWDLYRRLISARWRWILHSWSSLIAVSVLTTYQHHFIDIPTGALLGLLCLWLWPLETASPLRDRRWTSSSARKKLALFYLLGASACFLLAGFMLKCFGGIALWFCWPGVALLMVSMHYALLGAEGFQKNAQGRPSIASRWLLMPYRYGAWINSRLWTRGQPMAVRIHGNVWLGRMPTAAQARRLNVARLVDVSAELSSPIGIPTRCVPMLDLIAPDAQQLHDAVDAIDAQHDLVERGLVQGGNDGIVLVCCALGYSRSAAAVAAWLMHNGHVNDLDAAIALLKTQRPQLVLHDAHRAALMPFELRE